MDPRYPIGTCQPAPFSEEAKAERLADLHFLPGLAEQAIENLDADQLQTPYRDGGWTVQQVIHHLADSHMNALIRLKLTLTEDHPTVKPYDEERWAQTHEYAQLPVNNALTLLHTVHARLYDLYSHLQADEWKRTYFHPGSGTSHDLWYLLGLYAWHGKHHVAQV
ncbi:MAG TPA: putative metal-dependent hydrolase, partial [Lacibacter sp.]|nr:putative metal-dependent hydrolase [Lacibacter sp.]